MEVVATTDSLTKKRSRGPPQTLPWADLLMELLELIVAKLSFFNILRFKSVCSSWRRAADSYHDSPLYYSQTPLLMIPSSLYKQDDDKDNDDEDEQDEESINKRCICFYSLKDKTVYEFKNAPTSSTRVAASAHHADVSFFKTNTPILTYSIYSLDLWLNFPPKKLSHKLKVVPKTFGGQRNGWVQLQW